MKAPFEQILFEDEKYLSAIPHTDFTNHNFFEYLDFMKAICSGFGWNYEEYREEEIRRINKEWEPTYN